jgi:hypothetical protein
VLRVVINGVEGVLANLFVMFGWAIKNSVAIGYAVFVLFN